MSPGIQIDLNCQENKLDKYMYRLICAIKIHNIDIKDVAGILYNVIKTCDENSIVESNEIYEHIKNEFFNNFEIEIEMD